MFPLSTHIVEYNSKEFRSIPNLKIYNIDIDTIYNIDMDTIYVGY